MTAPRDVSDLNESDNIEKIEDVVSALKAIVASEGWKYYIAIMQQQQIARQHSIIATRIMSADEIYAQEYAKGEAAGLQIAIDLPEQMIDNLSEQVAALRKERGETE